MSLDGGGFRALGYLLVIDRITKETATRSHKTLLPCEVFDLICGTSAGGIVALLLGRLGLDCTTAIQVYKDLANSLFADPNEKDSWPSLMRPFDRRTLDFEARLEGLIGQYCAGNKDCLMVSSKDSANPPKSTKVFPLAGIR